MTPPRWLPEPGIRGKLLAGFVAVALFTGGLGVFAVNGLSRINESQIETYVDEFGGLNALTEYMDRAYRIRLAVFIYLETDDPAERQRLRQQIADGDALLSGLAARLDALDLNRDDVAALHKMTTAWDAFAEVRDRVVLGPGAEGADPATILAAFRAEAAPLASAFAAAADEYRQDKRTVAAELAGSAAQAYDRTFSVAIGWSLAAVLVALGIGIFLSRRISGAVRQVRDAAGKLAQGELDQQLDVHTRDELGEMADAFRHMVGYQQQMATVAAAIADGDLSLDVQPKSSADVLGTAFQRMSRNLRAMVGELEEHSEALGAQAQLLDLAPDAIIVRDPRTDRIRYWNRGAEELYGWTQAEVLGEVTHDLLHTEFPESATAVTDELARTGRWEGELVHTKQDGTRITVASRQAVQRDTAGQPLAVVTINTDVTQRIAAERALAQARDAAEAASRAKSEFLANTSHEIRTPMNAILGMAELLAETPLNDEQREYVRTFQRAGDTLLTLINDVLDLSKVEAGQLELEQIPFHLVELVEQTAEVLAVRAHAKGLELNVQVLADVPSYVMGDPTRLRQVLTNLMGNAIKFTDTGEVHLRVALDPVAPRSNSVAFSVRDTGIGIPAHKQGEIFASFVQADTSTTRRHGGTGLGLAISGRIVELMGGKIEVSSEVGQGSTFSFSIPLEAATIPTEQRPKDPTIDIHGWHVLVADDNDTNRLILRQFVTALGATVVEAEDGVEALAALNAAREQGRPFRLILLDGRMPHLDGFGVAATLREDLSTLGETVVMLTSDSRAGDVARARELGLGAYLVKPIKRAELLQTIAAVANLVAPPVQALAATQAPATRSEIVAGERPLRVLLVEDSPDNRMLIQAYLKKLPYEVDIAEDGQAGFDKVREQEYDLVLMDMLMPVMDGLDATRAIRRWERDEGRPYTPVVALTANAMEEDILRCLDAGCDAHVAKPVRKAALLASIERHARPVPSSG
jgi:PAS domain S-box-containing protein